MSRPAHLRTVHVAGHRIVNRSRYRTDDLVALVAVLVPWLRTVAPPETPTRHGGSVTLTFVSMRAPAPDHGDGADSEPSDTGPFLYPWIRRRGHLTVMLAAPHGPVPPDGLSEPLVQWLCMSLVDILCAEHKWQVPTESVPPEIAGMRVRTRRARGVVVRARVRNGMLFARATAAEASAHESLVALQDAVLQVRRLLVRLEVFLAAPALNDALADFDTATRRLELHLQHLQDSLRGPTRPTRTLVRVHDPQGHECSPAPTAPLRVRPGPHVSALGSLEIENHTVYRTADLLAMVNRVEAFAARSQEVAGAPIVSRALHVTTPLGHLPRLCFVHAAHSKAPDAGTGVAPLVAESGGACWPLCTVVLRAPEERTSEPLRFLSGALPHPRPADLRELARCVGHAFRPVPGETRRPTLHGLRLRVARHAPRSSWPIGPTATRRALRRCGELRAAMEVLRAAVDAAADAERNVATVLHKLYTLKASGRMHVLETPMRTLEETLDAIVGRLAAALPSR